MTRRLTVACCLAVLSACGGSSTSRGTTPPGERGNPLAGMHVEERRVKPSTPPADAYSEPLNHELGAPERVLVDAMTTLELVHSPSLSRVAEEIAREAPHRANVPPALVEGLMAWSGLVDPPPRLVIVELPNDSAGCHAALTGACAGAVESLIEQVQRARPEGPDILYGVGVAKLSANETRMVVALLERAVELEGFPSTVDTGGSITLHGRLLGTRERPRIEVIAPSGRWFKVPVAEARETGFEATVACAEERGVHQVELLADGVHGVEVVANFPLYCGVRQPADLRVELETMDPSVTAEQVARANFHYLNEERQRRGLSPLEWDPPVARLAHDHSADMLEHDFFGHRSPTTGEVSDRFSSAGIDGAVIRENVARGYGPKGIHDSLMGSPGHRINMLADDVTKVGIGVVIGEPQTDVEGAPRPILCTQNFFRPPGGGAPQSDAELAPQLRALIDARRQEEGLPPIRWVERLHQGAQTLARARAKGRDPKPGWDQSLYGAEYSAIESHQAQSSDYRALAGLDLGRPQTGIEAGLAVERMQGEDGPGFLLVVLVGKR